MRIRSTAFTLAAVFAGISGAAAQSYPSRPVTMVVPFAAGGPVAVGIGTDLQTRRQYSF